MPVKNINDVAVNDVKTGVSTTIQVLISPGEGPNFAMRRFIMQPGGSIPGHINTVEHEQFVLNGHARIGIGDETFEVKKGDVVFIPEGVPHWYQNLGIDDFEFLCIIPNKPDEIKLLDRSSC